MKFARPLYLIPGIVVLAGAVALGCLLTPAFQRWAVLRALAGRPDLKVEADEIAAGFSGLSLRGVRVDRNGVHVELARLEADYSLWQVLVARRLQVRQLTAAGILIDASKRTRKRVAAVAAAGPAAVPGLLARVQLPFALVLEDCRIEGRALLPGEAGKPPVEADYKITGGKFTPGQEGALLLAATLRNPAVDGGVAALNAQVSLRATQTAERGFRRVALTAVVDAEGKTFSEQNQLKIFAELTRAATGESYAVSVDTLIRGTAENLLAVRAALPAGREEYSGQWTLKARTAQLAPFALGTPLPEFDASGTGRFAFTPASRAVDLQGDLQIDASRLEAINAAWQAIGAVKLNAQFDVAADGDSARLRQLELRLAGEQPVLELHAASAAEFNFKERRLHVGGAVAGEVLTMDLRGLPLAWVQPFVPGVEVSGGMITGAFAITAEKDLLRLRSTRPLQAEALTAARQGQPLLDRATVSLSADAVLRVKALELGLTGLTLKTPLGDALTGEASILLPLQPDAAIAVAAGFSGDLPRLLAAWLPVGRVSTTGNADFTLAGDRLELRHAAAGFTDATGQTVLQVATLRPFVFDLASRHAVTGEKGAVDLARLTVGRVPLEEMPLHQPGARLGGAVTQGEFVLTADGDKLNLHTTAPVKMSGVALTQGGRPALAGLDLELAPVIELAGRAAAYQSGNVTVRNADGTLVASLKAEGSQGADGGQRGSMTFSLEVPPLSTQPLFAGAQAVSAGRASGEIRAAVGAASQVEARMTVNGLVARENDQTLPVANLSFRGVVQENGRISVQAPLLLDRAGQRSDLSFSLDLVPAGPGFGIDGKLTGEHVELADALAVLGVFRVSGAAPAAAPPAPVAPAEFPPTDAQSAWSRFHGQLTVDVKTVTRGTDWAMTGLSGTLLVDPVRLSLSKLEAAFGEKGRFTAKGDLGFVAGTQPYRLAGDFSLSEFDTGRLFKALDPSRPPTIEGIFNVSGHFSGQGGTVGQTGEQTRGRFELTSRQGVFRGLQRATSKLSVTTKAVELGASVLGSLFGSDKVTKAAEKVVGTAYFVDQLALNLNEINYDQLNVRLVRDETLNVALEDISLVSPEIRLLGKGTVTHVAGRRLLEQPLNATLTFSARGRIEQLLGKLHLLDGTRDELNYARTPTPVTLNGSLARPDPSAFFTKVASAKLSELLTPED